MTIDPGLVQQLIEQGEEPIPLFQTDPRDVRTCEKCDRKFTRPARRSRNDFATRRYCSKPCNSAARKGHDGVQLKRCRSDRHELTDANTIRDTKGRRRGCDDCRRERQSKRTGNRSSRVSRVVRPQSPAKLRKRTAKKDAVVPKQPVASPMLGPERPPWRPAGWSATPQNGARAGR